jgi:DNA repair protein RecN (Recombination protein N)
VLQTLRIRNYALIDRLAIDFRGGLNVLTGETGAGKSIIVGALNLILGARASTDAVRAGEKQATIEAVFQLPALSPTLAALLDEHGLELEDELLYVSRTISANGRSRALAGGALVPLNVLAAIGDELVDLHGQHEHQSLLHVSRQLDLLDAFAKTESEAAGVADTVTQLRDAQNELVDLENADRELERRIDFMRFELDEIEKANLRDDGEIAELEQIQARSTHAERIVTLANEAYGALSDAPDESSAIDRIGRAERALEDLAEIDARYAELAQRLSAARGEISDIASELNIDEEAFALDPAELNAVNARLETIRNLKRKYGETIAEILAYRDRIAEEVDRFANRDARIDALYKKCADLEELARKKATALSKRRAKAAEGLAKIASDTLQALGMKGARFRVAMEHGELTSRGIDRVAFELAPNTGEPFKPLKHAASGGEISRVMLAIKATFAEADSIPTLIFDEIDSGVGGAVANQVAERLRALSATHQVICITHLPQIAAAGYTHFHVSKSVKDDRTLTEVALVENEVRVRELARLLDGSVTEISLKHAESLLAERAS